MQAADCKDVSGGVVIEFLDDIFIYFRFVAKYHPAYEALRFIIESSDERFS